MTITYEDIVTMKRCIEAALAIEQGYATFVVCLGHFCAEIGRNPTAEAEFKFRVYHASDPDVTLAVGFARDFSRLVLHAESTLRGLEKALSGRAA